MEWGLFDVRRLLRAGWGSGRVFALFPRLAQGGKTVIKLAHGVRTFRGRCCHVGFQYLKL